MMDVFFTVDIAIWCDRWMDIDERFTASFRKYVYGPTAQGDYGLPYTLRVLADHGLACVFFVEPLFATRFGIEPFAEIVGLLKEAEQEIQLHTHTEWGGRIDRAAPHAYRHKAAVPQILFPRRANAPDSGGQRSTGKGGGPSVRAFRAGSFGFNFDTLGALADNQIVFDSSYNASISGLTSGAYRVSLLPMPSYARAFVNIR